MLEVVNNNDFTIADMFDGIPIEFPPGVKVDCTPAIAHHLFGYPGDDRDRAMHMARRFGWSTKDYLMPVGPSDDTPRYMKLAGNIVITPIFFQLVRVNPNDPIKLDTGDEDADRVVTPEIPAETTKAGRRKRTGKTSKREKAGAGVRLGSR